MDDDLDSPPELGDRSRSELVSQPIGEGAKKFNQFAKSLGQVMEDSPQVQDSDVEFPAAGKICSQDDSTGTALWNDAHKAQSVVEETRRCHSMSDLEHLEAAVWEIEDRFLEVKEMVDDDVLQLMYDFECVRDQLEESKPGIYADLFEIAQSFLDLSDYPEANTMGVMRSCRKIANNLSNKLQVWENEWGLPNYYMKLLFIVSRCSRLAYCIHPLDDKIEAKLSRISPSRHPPFISTTVSAESVCSVSAFSSSGRELRSFESLRDEPAPAAAALLLRAHHADRDSGDGTDSDSGTEMSRSHHAVAEHAHGAASPVAGAAELFMRQRSQSTLSVPSSEELGREGREDKRLAACTEKLQGLVQKLALLKEAESSKAGLRPHRRNLAKRDSTGSVGTAGTASPMSGSVLAPPFSPSASTTDSGDCTLGASPRTLPTASSSPVPPLAPVLGASGVGSSGLGSGGATPSSGTPPTGSNLNAIMAMRRGRAAAEKKRSESPHAERSGVTSPGRSRNTSPGARRRKERGDLSSRVSLESPIYVVDDTSLNSPQVGGADSKRHPLELLGVSPELWSSVVGKGEQGLSVNLDILLDMASSSLHADSQRTLEYLLQSLETFSDIGRALPVSEVLGPHIEELSQLLKDKLNLVRETELLHDRILQWHRLESATTGPNSPSVSSLKAPEGNRSLSPMLALAAEPPPGKDSPVSNASSETAPPGRAKMRARSFNIGRQLTKPRPRHFELSTGGEAGGHGYGSSTPSDSPHKLSPTTSPQLSPDFAGTPVGAMSPMVAAEHKRVDLQPPPPPPMEPKMELPQTLHAAINEEVGSGATAKAQAQASALAGTADQREGGGEGEGGGGAAAATEASSTASSAATRTPCNQQLKPGIKRRELGISDFETVKPISKGAFGVVYLCRHKQTGELYAVKVLKKADIRRKNQFKYVKAEKTIMATVDCPFVVKLICSFQTRENLFLVMEYVQGGDCYTLLQGIGALHEDWARQYMAEMVLALEHLHQKRIVHRDLKPDNILINSDGHLKLTDFGLSDMGLMDKSELSVLATPTTPSMSTPARMRSPRHRSPARKEMVEWRKDASPMARRAQSPRRPTSPRRPHSPRRRDTSPRREFSPEGRGEQTSWEEGGIPNFGQRLGSPTAKSRGMPPLPPRGRAMRAYEDLDPGGRSVRFDEEAEAGEEEEEELDLGLPPDAEGVERPPFLAGGAGGGAGADKKSVPQLKLWDEVGREGSSGRSLQRGSSQLEEQDEFDEDAPPRMDRLNSTDVDRPLPGSAKKKRREDIVGTPEYLSPEILLGQEHSFGVDWWALGVILFELLCGVPPFTGDTPELVFEAILSAKIPWDLADDAEIELSDEARDFISQLLDRNPKKRLGYRGAAEVKAHPFLRSIEWDRITVDDPVFIPSFDDAFDTSYFDPHRKRHPSLMMLAADDDPLMSEEDDELQQGLAQTGSSSAKEDFSNFNFTDPKFFN